MRFSRLRLNGFKSFVDPTDLVIQQGLTGVVGPNGCGKSNLLEALRWVMGENRPTAMRGSGMEDVIFNGAATRGPRNHAEVSLTIDNIDRLAPAGFNDSDTIEVVRRITRDAGSAYKANSKDVRARDVQMLFADASTGSASPALVRQGQIAELINAKPKARRRILEEAAGISGLYARRHEAELKLAATETNLSRVDDVLEQLAQQLSVLTRQARQAARYREVSEDLRKAEGMFLFQRWREADEACLTNQTALQECLQAGGVMQKGLEQARDAREAAEQALPPKRDEAAIAFAITQRLIVQRESLDAEDAQALAKIDALKARLAQMRADVEREAALNHDAGEEIATLRDEIEAIAAYQDGYDDLLREAGEAAQEAGAILTDREAVLGEATEDAARLSARHQSATRLIGDSRRLYERAEAEAVRMREAVVTGQAQLDAALDALNTALEAREISAEEIERTEAALEIAESVRAQLQSVETEARALRSAVGSEADALGAELAALEKVIARDSSDKGQLLDQITVVRGYEKALGAALSEDLTAPQLAEGERTGWQALPDYPQVQALPQGAQALSDYVSGPAALTRRLAQIGLVTAAQGAALHADLLPGQRLVSLDGDLWRWDGYQAAAQDRPSAAALRLEQLNRLAELREEFNAAQTRAEAAKAEHAAAQAKLTQAVRDDQLAREARRHADQKQAEADRNLSRAEAERTLAAGRFESTTLARKRAEDGVMSAHTQLREAETGLKDLPDLDAARRLVEDARFAVDAARIAMLTRRSAHDALRREGEERLRRRADAQKELQTWNQRLATAERRKAELDLRCEQTQEALDEALEVPQELAAKREDLGDDITKAEARAHAAADALSQAEALVRDWTTAEREVERLAGEAREEKARAETKLEASLAALAVAAERIMEQTERTPEELLISLRVAPEDMPNLDLLDQEVTRLKKLRDGLGAVNLRAEDDAKAVDDEYLQLATEKGDLEEAVKRLRAGIAGLNKEGRDRLLEAFDQVNENFGTLFPHLFGGGEAKLVLIESDDPLDAGLEILCQPPGKRLSTLSLLSGGEQTLTALALIFAVFLANPAPICVLDEVDAPLDDANVTRFCDLLDEMTRRTQTRFLVITHHAVTMARMDRLFGVTMQEQGVSQLVSVDLSKAESLVA